jgi:hypothetical protein
MTVNKRWRRRIATLYLAPSPQRVVAVVACGTGVQNLPQAAALVVAVRARLRKPGRRKHPKRQSIARKYMEAPEAGLRQITVVAGGGGASADWRLTVQVQPAAAAAAGTASSISGGSVTYAGGGGGGTYAGGTAGSGGTGGGGTGQVSSTAATSGTANTRWRRRWWRTGSYRREAAPAAPASSSSKYSGTRAVCRSHVRPHERHMDCPERCHRG